MKIMKSTATPTLLNKPVRIVASASFNDMYGGIEAGLYIGIALEILQKHPHDMLVFEMANESCLQVRLAGYHLQTQKLNEKSVVFKTESLSIKTFWVKVDDYGTEYILTFLFPEDY